MKNRKLILLLFCLFIFIFGQAQISKTVTVTAGGLKGSLSKSEYKTVNNLKVSGTLNAADFFFMRDSLSILKELDLSEARITSPLDTIPDRAFYSKRTLQKIVFPINLARIGMAAFYECTSLMSAEIPNTVTSIGYSAFSKCSFTSVILPTTNTSNYVGAFSDCKSLVTATTACTYDGGDIFSSCDNLRNIIVPEGVTTIKAGAFYQLTSMTSIKLPSTITLIGDQAFYNCSSLDSITLPEGVTSFERVHFGNVIK